MASATRSTTWPFSKSIAAYFCLVESSESLKVSTKKWQQCKRQKDMHKNHMKYYEVTSAKTCHNLDILCRKVGAGTLSLWHRLTLSWFCIAKPQFEASEQTPYIHPWHIQFQRHLAAVLRLFQNMSSTSSIDLANHSLCTYTHSLRVPGCVCVQGTQSNWSFSTHHLWWKTHAQLIWYIIWVPLIVLTCADRATNFFGQLELMLNHD